MNKYLKLLAVIFLLLGVEKTIAQNYYSINSELVEPTQAWYIGATRYLNFRLIGTTTTVPSTLRYQYYKITFPSEMIVDDALPYTVQGAPAISRSANYTIVSQGIEANKKYIVIKLNWTSTSATSFNELYQFKMVIKDCAPGATPHSYTSYDWGTVTPLNSSTYTDVVAAPVGYSQNNPAPPFNHLRNGVLVRSEPLVADNHSITNGNTGASYNRVYRVRVKDENSNGYAGRLVFKSLFDQALNVTAVSLKIKVQNGTEYTYPAGSIITTTGTESGLNYRQVIFDFTNPGLFYNQFGFRVPNEAEFIFTESINVISCLDSKGNSTVTIENKFWDNTSCGLVATYLPVVQRGTGRPQLVKISDTVTPNSGMLMGTDAPLNPQRGICLGPNEYTNRRIEYRNNGAAAISANIDKVFFQNLNEIRVPLSSIVITKIGEGNPPIKVITGTSASTRIPQNYYNWETNFILAANTDHCIGNGTPTDIVQRYWVDLFDGADKLEIKSGESIVVEWREYQCPTESLSPTYQGTYVNIVYEGDCPGGVTYSLEQDQIRPNDDYIYKFYTKSSIRQPYSSRMAGRINRVQQLWDGVTTDVNINIDRLEGLLTNYRLAEGRLLVEVLTEHGLTADLQSQDPFSIITHNNFNVVLTLSNGTTVLVPAYVAGSYEQDNNTTTAPGTISRKVIYRTAQFKTAHKIVFAVNLTDLIAGLSSDPNTRRGRLNELLMNASLTVRLKAYCTPMPNTHFNVNMNYEPSINCGGSTLPPGPSTVMHLFRFEGKTMVTCPGCVTPGLALDQITGPFRIATIPGNVGVSDANNDRVPDNGAVNCTGCALNIATFGDVMEVNLSSGFPDGGTGGYVYSQIPSALAHKNVMCQITGFKGLRIRQLTATLNGGSVVTIPLTSITSKNTGNTWDTYDAATHTNRDELLVNLPVTLFGASEYTYGGSQRIQLNVEFEIVDKLFDLADIKEINYYMYASDRFVTPDLVTGDASGVPVTGVVSGMSFWCERNASSFKYIPTSFTPVPGNVWAAGTSCETEFSSGGAVTADNGAGGWDNGFINEYRPYNYPSKIEVFVPKEYTASKLYLYNWVRLNAYINATQYNASLQIYALPLNTLPSFVTRTQTANGTLYTIQNLPLENITDNPAILSSLAANHSALQPWTTTSKLYRSDDLAFVYAIAFGSPTSCDTDPTKTHIVLNYNGRYAAASDRIMYNGTPGASPALTASVTYPNMTFIPNQTNFINNVYGYTEIIIKPKTNLTASYASPQNVTITNNSFSFNIRFANKQPLKTDNSKYTVFDQEIQSMNAENTFVYFPNRPAELKITKITRLSDNQVFLPVYLGTSPEPFFQLGTIPKSSDPGTDYMIEGSYICSNYCNPSAAKCLDNFDLKLRYGWGCATYPSSITDLSTQCNLEELDYYISTAGVAFGVTASLYKVVSGTETLLTGASPLVDYCAVNAYKANLAITPQATGVLKKFNLTSVVPAGYTYDNSRTSTVAYNGSSVVLTAPVVTIDAGTGATTITYADFGIPGYPDGIASDLINQPVYINVPLKSDCNRLVGNTVFSYQVGSKNYCGAYSNVSATSTFIVTSALQTFKPYTITTCNYNSSSICLTPVAGTGGGSYTENGYVTFTPGAGVSFTGFQYYSPTLSWTSITPAKQVGNKYYFKLSDLANGTSFNPIVAFYTYTPNSTTPYDITVKATVESGQYLCSNACLYTQQMVEKVFVIQSCPGKVAYGLVDFSPLVGSVSKLITFKNQNYLFGLFVSGVYDQYANFIKIPDLNNSTSLDIYAQGVGYNFGMNATYGSSYSNAYEVPSATYNQLGTEQQIELLSNTYWKVVASDANYIYVGGRFSNINTGIPANGVGQAFLTTFAVNNIAKYDGTTWSTVGTGLPQTVTGLATSGTKVWAVVNNKDFYEFSGTNWTLKASATGTIEGIEYANGKVFVYGSFTSLGVSGLGGLCTYDAATSTWTGVGPGVQGTVKCIKWINSKLYIAGNFTTGLNKTVNNVLSYDGTNWSTTTQMVGDGLAGYVVNDLIYYDTRLYAAVNYYPYIKKLNTSTNKWENGVMYWAGRDNVERYVGSSSEGVKSLQQINGKLYMAGAKRFTSMNSIYASTISYLDCMSQNDIASYELKERIINLPAADFCLNQSVTLQSSKDLTGHSVRWICGGPSGSYVYTTLNPVVTFTNEGKWIIRLIVDNESVDVQYVKVGTNLTSISAGLGNICQSKIMSIYTQNGIARSYSWSPANQVINPTSPVTYFNINTPTTFTLTATSDAGCISTAQITVTPQACPARMEEETESQSNLAESLLVYPNPFHSDLTVSSSEGLITGLELFDAVGRKVRSVTNIETNQYTIQTQELGEAVYILHVLLASGEKKIVKLTKFD